MANLEIQPLVEADLGYVSEKLRLHFGSDWVVSRGQLHECLELKGYLAWMGGERVGFVQYDVNGGELEIVALASDKTGRGVGRQLLEAVTIYCRQHTLKRCWLVTTNNNQVAIGLYKKLGWQLVHVHADALVESRKLKPEIPEFDSAGVPISDELEFEFPLEGSS